MAPVKRKSAMIDSPTVAMAKTKTATAETRPRKRPRKSGAELPPKKKVSDRERGPSKTAEDTSHYSSALREEEPAFPRGGASILTPLEHKQIQIEATRDVLFEQDTAKKGKPQNDENLLVENGGPISPKKKRRLKAANGNQKRHGEAVEPGLRIEGLSYSRLVPGSMVLGTVSQINQHDLALALPNNLTGYVPITAISDQFTKAIESLIEEGSEMEENSKDEEQDVKDVELRSLFTLGQYLRACVTSTGEESLVPGTPRGKKRIELSINPKLANSGLSKSDVIVNSMVQASVVSIEDHGLVMDLGLEEGLKGFMSSKEVGYSIDYTSIQEGTVLLCMVIGLSPNGGIVKLSADYQKAGNLKKSHFLSEAPTVNALLPGSAVEVLVSDIQINGMAGKVMGMVDVTADLFQSGSAQGISLEKRHKIGDKIKGRIICTFPTVEPVKLGVSLLDHVTSFTSLKASESQSPIDRIPISTKIEAAEVIKVSPGIGLFLDLGEKAVRGYVHISRIKDGKVDDLSELSGSYKVGSLHPTRIVGYNAMDGLYLASMEQKILDQPFLRIEDVPVGGLVKGRIEKIVVNENGVGGLLVNLAEHITGLVPEMHLADVKLQHPERKFKEGMQVTARVLSTNPEKRQLKLTLKKTLINSDLPILKSYDDAELGKGYLGTIVSLLPNGGVVQFYGIVRAFLPVSEMSESFIKDPRQHFKTGQVLSVYVLTVDPENSKLLVSCKDPSSFGPDQQRALKELDVGSLIDGTVIENSSKDIVIELDDIGLKAILPQGHLTDGSEAKNSSAMRKAKVGQRMKSMVWNKNEARRLIILTSKPSLLKASIDGSLIRAFDDVKEGRLARGSVKNISASGVFVEFAGGLTGLLPKRNLPSDKRDLHEFGMTLHQSITSRVDSVNYQESKFILSLAGEQNDQKSSEKDESVGLSNPVDSAATALDYFTYGLRTKAQISSVKETQINMRLADGVQGRISISEVFDSWDDIKDKKAPLKPFKRNQILEVRVMGIHDARNHRFLPISHRSSNVPVFELSAKRGVLKALELEILSLENIEVGSTRVGFINNITEDCAWVTISPNVRGRIKILDLSEDMSALGNVQKSFPVGCAVKARVTAVDAANNRLDLAVRSEDSIGSLTFDSLAKGMVLPGRITRIGERQVIVQLSEQVFGSVGLTDIADDYSQASPTKFRKNVIVRVCVIGLDASNKRLTLSTRPSRVLSSASPVEDPEINTLAALKVSDVVRGFVKNVADHGVFITIGADVTAFVRVADISDSFVKDWKSILHVDQLVKGKVVGLDTAANHVQMSLKRSVIDKNYKAPIVFSDLQLGQIVTGKVRKVEDFGVFIVVDNSSNVSGLCHRSEMADHPFDDVKSLYEEGDLVKAKVLKLDLTRRRVNFGLKPSLFTEDEVNMQEPIGAREEDGEEGGVSTLNGSDDRAVKDATDHSDQMSGVEDEGGADGASTTDDKPMDRVVENSMMGLRTGGFDWTASTLDSDLKRSASDSDDVEENEKRTRKKRRKPQILVDRTGDLDAHGPQSTADFERLLLGQPNSSYLWVSYMAFQLQLSEVDEARGVAERALRTISIREDAEKLNVWIASLNLENTYGSDETIEEVFKKACQYCDAEKIHESLVSIYIQSGKPQKADALYQVMTKKFSQNPKVWINYAHFLFNSASPPLPDRGRALLARALQALPSHTHISLTTKFAQLEFKSSPGDPERGRTIFEGLLDQWPKRWDVWNILLDMEIRLGDEEQIRRIFGRVTEAKGMKPKKAKWFFKRWLDWEEQHGNARSIENVKARAAEFVRNAKSTADDG